MTELIGWLLEDGNPAVRYRTQTEILHQAGDKESVKNWIFAHVPANWHQAKGLWYRYYITAFAECGLTREDLPYETLEEAFAALEKGFECGCGDFLLAAALVKLGFGAHKTVRGVIDACGGSTLPDGGYLCLHRLRKLPYTPKSCYKANLHALLFFAACRRRGVDAGDARPLAAYFLERNLFYKSADPRALVLQARAGWRTIDPFYPFEVMRVGVQNVVAAFCALGYGDHPRLREARRMLDACKDGAGRVILKGTLTKSYLPKERVGAPSKWATFYAVLAERLCMEAPPKRYGADALERKT